MASDLSSHVFKLLILSSCMLVGGQNCSISEYQFHSYPVTLSAESVNESTPAVRVTWRTAVPPECVASVRVVFRRSGIGTVTSYTTTNTSGTQVIQSPLQCATEYYVRVFVAAVQRLGGVREQSMQQRVVVGDVAGPFIVRAEVTADNTSIRVSWDWSCQGVPVYINNVRVDYRPEGGSLMMHTVDSTTATTATLPNLQCNTKYTIWVHAEGGQFNGTSVPRMVSLPARAPPTPTDVTVWLMNASSVRVAWQWTSSGSAPNCFNTTTVTYHPEGGGESSLQLSDPAATETTLTNLQCNTNYTIIVVATAGEHRREGVVRKVHLPVQAPVEVRAEATADNTSIRVSWEWSCQGVLDLVRVHYQPEGGSLMMHTVDNTTATSATLPNLQCNTEYTIWVHARGSQINKTSVPRKVYLPARAPPTPTDVTTQCINPSSVRIAWQWTSSGPALNCFNMTTVTYRPEGGGESFLQLSDPAANEATLTGLQNNRCYAITVVATAGEHRKEGVTLQGTTSMCPEDPDTPPISPEVSSQCMSTSAVAGVAVTAVLVLLVVAVVQSAVIWYLKRSIDKIKSQTQRATAVTAEIPLKECSAYGQIDQGDEREEPHIYERPQ